jgi:hypothetical protein
MASCAAGLFAAAAMLGLISLAVPASPDIRAGVVLADSLAALLLGVVTFALRRRMTLTLMVGIYTQIRLRHGPGTPARRPCRFTCASPAN